MKLAVPIVLSYKMAASTIAGKVRDGETHIAQYVLGGCLSFDLDNLPAPADVAGDLKLRLWNEQHANAAPMIAAM